VLFVAALLSLVLIGSVVFARSLVKPLGRLARAARAFGRGDLSVRVGLRRKDELGDVAQAFDDMAERITLLIQTQRELLANVSHELRTPLARIRVALDLATEGDSAAARDALASITTDWGDLERLVEDVLATARLDLGSSGAAPPLRRDEVDVEQLARAVETRFSLVYPGSVLDVEIEPGLPPLIGDRALLKRVLDNLVDNARKYSDAESPVGLHVTSEPEGICLSVVDRGMGIESADLPHIFTPFFRADRSRTRKTGGVGMGLALVRRIVHAHGGRIDVDSEPGRGTSMEVHLPRLAPAEPGSAPATPRAAG
jgi:signal transduction histidine kinase